MRPTAFGVRVGRETAFLGVEMCHFGTFMSCAHRTAEGEEDNVVHRDANRYVRTALCSLA